MRRARALWTIARLAAHDDPSDRLHLVDVEHVDVYCTAGIGTGTDEAGRSVTFVGSPGAMLAIEAALARGEGAQALVPAWAITASSERGGTYRLN